MVTLNDHGGGGYEHKVEVYVTSTRSINVPLSEEEHKSLTQRTAQFLVERFGGATSIAATGYYPTQSSVVIEAVFIVYAYAASLSTEDREAVYDYGQTIKLEYGQASIAIVIDGRLFLI